jgi:glycosyltransferase involved in cell wall biosynthesis
VPIYNAAEVFVHPSLYEGFSMTTVEAFACGAPVIAANRGGLGELAGGYAHMVDDPTEETLAAAIDEVLGDAALRDRLRRRSVERAKDLRWERTARETLSVLELAVANAGRNLGGAVVGPQRLT